ncbi:IS630-like element IS14999 family transposase [Corynebacterium glutamicum]|uniref:IS630-like element IS14999 family transposase n=1 Tax=Corynebacterium glutamicum TaxID=1718 RepID=UPI001C6E69F1|nr:IS630-like element IS14999 family transposase [Corynebacterium glutamicum]QYR17694.1 IS630-like element IS14999 family transposase [Corynebacterium glutamicum]QYR17869.1 IS630-like element IS14999 family transposase [Corynebacterium glutamicum]QYR18132.1 IS630-like element IS14999 family transposase [Corynebacterium glutamicum]QYR18471.1 IS630-like element IS14999 family transposase [Corynebacterium glutamicum]
MAATLTTALTGEEITILKSYKRSRFSLVQHKAEALLLLEDGVTLDIIARFVERQPSTITTWITDFNRLRTASLFTGHATNTNASKLTPTQREEIATVLSQPPSTQSIPSQFWTVPQLKDWVASQFEVVYDSDTTYHLLLRHAGLSFKYPQVFDKRRGSDTEINARIAEIREEIADALQDPDQVVFAADEVRVEHEAEVRKAWIHKHAPTTLSVDRVRQAQSYIGFLSQTTGEVDLLRLTWQNTETIVEALTTLVGRYPDKKITIVWDNARWHRSKKLREHLGEGNPLANVHLVWLPPYAPDHNPIEKVWNEAKAAISNRQRLVFEDTCIGFETFVGSSAFAYRI